MIDHQFEFGGLFYRQIGRGASKHEERITMSKQKNAIAVRAIGIDTGKNTRHMDVARGQTGITLIYFMSFEACTKHRSTTQ